MSFILQALSAASVTVYRSVVERFFPSSSHLHYLINMHDLLNVYKGLLLLSPDTEAQMPPQFRLLNCRGLQSSRHSKTLSSLQKKSHLNLRIGTMGIEQLPSIVGKTNAMSRKNPVKDSNELDREKTISTLRMVIRVWCHESTRVYLDRSTESRDHLWFFVLLESCIKYCFCGIRFRRNLPPKAIAHAAGVHYKEIHQWEISFLVFHIFNAIFSEHTCL